jgi:hypothetical protein
LSDRRAKAVRTSFEQVQAILHGEWDPIGCGVPLDEYDSYAWPVLKLLMDRANRALVESYLREAAQEMSSPVPDERLRSVVDRLMGLRV